MVKALGMTGSGERTGNYPPPPFAPPRGVNFPAYGPREKEAIAKLDSHVTPTDRRILRASPAMTKAMTDLALDPKLLEQYKADPHAVAETMKELSSVEKAAMGTGHAGAIYAVMTATPSDITNNSEPTIEAMNPTTSEAAFILVPPLAPPVLLAIPPLVPPVLVIVIAL